MIIYDVHGGGILGDGRYVAFGFCFDVGVVYFGFIFHSMFLSG